MYRLCYYCFVYRTFLLDTSSVVHDVCSKLPTRRLKITITCLYRRDELNVSKTIGTLLLGHFKYVLNKTGLG